MRLDYILELHVLLLQLRDLQEQDIVVIDRELLPLCQMLEVVNQSGLVLFAKLKHFLDEELFPLPFEGYCLAAEKEARDVFDVFV